MENSILDQVSELNKNTFEEAIACGSSKKDLVILFGKENDLEKWCVENYGLHFDEAYQKVLRVVRNNFLKTCTYLSEKGNQTAINILMNFVMNYQQNSQTGNGITIINNIPGGEKNGDK